MNFNDKLDCDKIKENLLCKRIGTDIVIFSSTSSTNDVAWEYALNENNDGLVIFAEKQSAGRGRNGNRWLDEPGQSLLFSVLLADSDFDAETLSLTCAVAIAEAIDKVGKHQVKIKWPNDIIVNSKKTTLTILEEGVNSDVHANKLLPKIKQTDFEILQNKLGTNQMLTQ